MKKKRNPSRQIRRAERKEAKLVAKKLRNMLTFVFYLVSRISPVVVRLLDIIIEILKKTD